MNNIIVCGCSTDVGKTVVSAILAKALQADYWKPVQCGDAKKSDSGTIKKLSPKTKVHPPAYTLKAPVSPHYAARLENIVIDPSKIVLPPSQVPLIIEMAGGLLVPLNRDLLSFNLFRSWDAAWVVVSRNYIGSINHTLLTLEVLRSHGLSVHSVVFNGEPNPDSEEAILHFSGLPCLGRLLPEPNIDPKTIERYAQLWKGKQGYI